jgi:aryl carrier-like protein
VLDGLPVTVNGKLDRKALPEPDGMRLDTGQGYEAPRTSSEEVLAGIWSEVLGMDRVGIHDNYFELGGNSILSITIMERAHQAGIEITLVQFFTHPTIADLSEELEREGEQPGEGK